MHLHSSSSPEVQITIRASRQTGLFDLVSISDMDGAKEEAIRLLDMSDVEHLSVMFWPEQPWRERLQMLKRAAPTSREQWVAAQLLMGAAHEVRRNG